MGIFDVFSRKEAEYYKVKFFESNKIYQKAREAMADGSQAKGFKLYCKAAEGYHWLAKYMVGYCYEAGTGVAKSNPKAFEIYSKIAKETYPHGDYFSDFMNKCAIGNAKYRTALFLQNGWDVPQDTVKSLEILSGINTGTDGAEAAFGAAIELHINYHYGKNGCSQNFAMSHIYAVKAINAFENYQDDARHYNFIIDSNSINNHRSVLQYAAYNLENGRGVKMNLKKGLEYRLKSVELYNHTDDIFSAGMDCYALGDIKNAEKMLKQAHEGNNKHWADKAAKKLDEIKTERNNAYKAAKASHLKNVKEGDEKALLREAGFKAWGRRRYYTGNLFGFVVRTIPSDIDWALDTVLNLVKKDVTDNTPLPDIDSMRFLLLETKQENYQKYAVARIKEKAGQSFGGVETEYLFAALSGHIESMFRYEQLGCLVLEREDQLKKPYDRTKETGRPVYNTLSNPTLALVQLAEKQDPEAIVDLARIYKAKNNDAMVEALRLIAAAIYRSRADAGDPEAIYNLGCIISQAAQDFSEGMFDKHYLFYLHLAYLHTYGKASADYSSDRLYGGYAFRVEMRKEADSKGANKESYFPYFNITEDTFKREMRFANSFFESQKEMREKNPDDPAVIKSDYFKKVCRFIISQKPFTDPEMHQLIADGVIDGLGDKHLAEVIKRAAIPPSEEELEMIARSKDVGERLSQSILDKAAENGSSEAQSS